MTELVTEPVAQVQAAEPAEPAGQGVEHRPSVHKNFVIYVSAQLLTWTVTFISLSVIPRLLGEDSSGKIVVASTAATLPTSLLTLGIDQFLMKEIGRDPSQTKRLLGGLVGLRIALLFVAIFGTVLTGTLLHATAFDWVLIAIWMPSAFAGFFTIGFRSVFTGHEQAKRVSASDLIATCSSLFAIPFLSHGPIALAVAGSATMVLNVTLQWRWVRQIAHVVPIVDRRLWTELVRAGLPFCVNTYLLASYAFVQVFIMRRMVGDAGVGVSGQVTRLFGTFMFIPVAMTSALLPSLARMADSDPEAFNRTKLRVLGLLVVLGLPVEILMIVLGPPLCQLLYSKGKFIEMPLALQTIALAIIPMYIVSSMYQFLVAQGRAGVWSRFLASTVVIYGIVAALAIPACQRMFQNGPMGGAVATVVAEMASAIAAIILLKVNLFDRDLRSRMVRAILAAGAMAAVMLGALKAVTMALPQENEIALALRLIIPGGIGLATFAGLAWALKVLYPQDQEKLASMLTKGFGRLRRSSQAQA
jgi:O-antigen/teichoic acid export membrane protein